MKEIGHITQTGNYNTIGSLKQRIQDDIMGDQY